MPKFNPLNTPSTTYITIKGNKITKAKLKTLLKYVLKNSSFEPDQDDVIVLVLPYTAKFESILAKVGTLSEHLTLSRTAPQPITDEIKELLELYNVNGFGQPAAKEKSSDES